MLSFVLQHVPDQWEDVAVYSNSYELFTVPGPHSREYQKVEQHFRGTQISRVQRVQNPFQYGRYMLMREMVRTNYEVSGRPLIIRRWLYIGRTDGFSKYKPYCCYPSFSGHRVSRRAPGQS